MEEMSDEDFANQVLDVLVNHNIVQSVLAPRKSAIGTLRARLQRYDQAVKILGGHPANAVYIANEVVGKLKASEDRAMELEAKLKEANAKIEDLDIKLHGALKDANEANDEAAEHIRERDFLKNELNEATHRYNSLIEALRDVMRGGR